MTVESVAVVGIVGGAGTTRTTLELAGALARAGRSALVLDLDFATQGLARFVEARIEPDSAALLAEPDVDLEGAVQDWPVEGQGRLGLVPAFAPFAELARAKSASAGERVGDRIEAASDSFDHVLLDVPPVATNQAVGAVTAADRVVGVIPATNRGVDSLQRERGRLADVGAAFDAVLAVGTTAADAPPDADHWIPGLPSEAPAYGPASLDTAGGFTEQVAAVADDLFEVALAGEIEASSSVLGRLETTLRS